MTAARRKGIVMLLALLVLAAVTAGYLYYRDRTVVLGEQHGDPALVAARSVPVRSAEVIRDGRHVRVEYIGGDLPSGGCREFSSVRVTKRRGEVDVRVQEGVRAGRRGVCTLGGKDKTLLVPIREALPMGTSVRRVM